VTGHAGAPAKASGETLTSHSTWEAASASPQASSPASPSWISWPPPTMATIVDHPAFRDMISSTSAASDVVRLAWRFWSLAAFQARWASSNTMMFSCGGRSRWFTPYSLMNSCTFCTRSSALRVAGRRPPIRGAASRISASLSTLTRGPFPERKVAAVSTPCCTVGSRTAARPASVFPDPGTPVMKQRARRLLARAAPIVLAIAWTVASRLSA
jgi:hypothetical protein